MPATIRVKICGITTPGDAVAAARAGADALGLNFVSGPRRLHVDAAADILAAIPPFCMPVALVDVSNGDIPEDLLELLGHHWVSHVQLYGQVEASTVARLIAYGFRPILVQSVKPDEFPGNVDRKLAAMSAFPPTALLLDAHREGMAGGTGTLADWGAVAAARARVAAEQWPPLILAGGLTPENVADAIRAVRPWAVDVSSGVESSAGRKDAARMRALVLEVRRAEAEP